MSVSKISGFPEYLPGWQLAFNAVLDKIREKFELFGFSPLDTPAVERVSTLLAKGNDNEIYGVYRVADVNDKKDLALRFDLTVPLARYVAQHEGELVFPYKRYHIAPVWRGERAQAGRYRQFYQCDIDIVDNEQLSLNSDAEIVSVVYEIFKSFELDFEIKINNKKILDGFVNHVVGDKIPSSDILKIIDKKEKISEKQFIEMFYSLGLDDSQVKQITSLLDYPESNVDLVNYLKSLDYNETFKRGVSELEELYNYLKLFGVDYSNIKLDISLARGLTYYTGSIFEVKLRNSTFTSSVAGGGRYDNLTEYFSNKKFPGVGVSFGISRLINILVEKGLVRTDKATPADVLVTVQERKNMDKYIEIASLVRNGGIKTELFLQGKKLGQQMNYASKKGFKLAIIANEDELSKGVVNLRNMQTGEQEIVPIHDIVAKIR